MILRRMLIVVLFGAPLLWAQRPCNECENDSAKLACYKAANQTEEALALLSEKMLKDSSLAVSLDYLHLLQIKKDKGGLKRFGPIFVRRFIDSTGGFWDAVKIMALQGQLDRATRIMASRCTQTGEVEDLMRMARILVEAGARSQAEAILEKAEQQAGESAEIYYLRGQLVFVQSLLEKVLNRQERRVLQEKALPFIEKAIVLDSGNVSYTSYRIRLLDSLGQFQEACSSCVKAARRFPPDAKLDGYCGAVFFKAGQYFGAINHYERAYTTDSFNIDNLLNLEKSYRRIGEGNAYVLIGLERLANAMPDTLSIRYNLAIEFFTRDSLARAEKAFRQVLKKNPDYEDANKGIAAVLLKMGKQEESFQFLRKQNQLRGTDEKDRFAEAQMILLKGDTAAAVDGFEKVLLSNPRHGGAAYTLATFAFNKAEWERVVTLFKYPEYCPDTLGTCRMLGTALYHLNRDTNRALALLRRALAAPDADEPLYFMIADLLEKMGNAKGAAEGFSECISRFPDSDNRAYYESRLKQLKK